MRAFLACVLAAALLLSPALAGAETRLMAVSDLHYLAPEYYRDSELFLRALRSGDGKMPQYGEELMAALLAEAQRARPDALIVTGDLTFNGERASHEKLAAWFSRFEAAGIPVWVIPGNHDINSPSARAYLPNGWAEKENVTPEMFAEIYADFMLPGNGSANLSYTVPVNDGLWLAMTDVSVYRPAAQTFGLYTAGHDKWLRETLRQARAAGAEVITCTHQNLIAHTSFLRDSFLMLGSESMAALAREYGVRLNLSGHMHMQHIAEQEGLTDAALGGFCLYPHRYALIALAEDGTLQYEALSLSDDFLPEGFLRQSRDWFTGITKEKTVASLSGMEIPAEDRESMLDYMARFNLAYFSGEYSSDDPAWREDAGYKLWAQYARPVLDAYLGQLMAESPGSQLQRTLPPIRR